MTPFRSLSFFLVLMLLGVSGSLVAHATSVVPAPNPEARAAAPVPSLPPVAGDKSKETKKAAEILQSYSEPNYKNLTRSLWALNVHRLDDDQAVDNFLKITECDLYTRFFFNEFEWKKIREATRDYLSKYKSSFPRRYEYVQPLLLDRYDFDLKGFAIVPGSDFESSTRLEMAVGLQNNGGLCKSMGNAPIPGYPASMLLTLKQPFKISFVRVNQDIAQEYLKMIEQKGLDVNDGRPAYIRFRVRLDRFIGEENLAQGVYANFGGVLETIEVFADQDLMFKLYEQALY